MIRKCLAIVALVALLVVVTDASAACKGGKCKAKQANRNNVVNLNAGNNLNANNNGVRKQLVGNEIVTLDRFGNVLNREFVNNNRNVNVGVGIGVGRRSLADRLLGF